MRPLPIVGPSYSLRVSKAECRRSINLFPVLIEDGYGKNGARWYLQQIDGLTEFADLAGPLRALPMARGLLFAVVGEVFGSVEEDGTFAAIATLQTSSGFVDWDEGNNQLVLVDGPHGYVFDLDSSDFGRITSAAWLGSRTVSWIDGRFIFIRPDTGQFYYSQIDDASDLDALDFATAESSPDNLVGQIVSHGDLWLMGEKTIEPWYNSGDAAFTFVRNDGGIIEHGLVGPRAVCKLNGVVYWIGRSENGSPVLLAASAYSPARISQYALEQALGAVSDFSGAVLYAYQKDGLAFVIVQVPGLETSWGFEVASQQWHERAELVDGRYERHRGQIHAYAYGRHFLGAEDGRVYALDSGNRLGGDVMCRDIVTPHYSVPTEELVEFGSLEILLNTGIGKPDGSAGLVMMRSSNDGGEEFGSWITASAGVVGARQTRLRWNRLGSSRDRVWHIRCTDDIPFNPVAAVVG